MRIGKGNYAIKGNNKQYAKVNKFSREPETFVFFNKMNFNKNVAYAHKDEWMSLVDFKKFIDQDTLLIKH